jgi:WS/DGAT/MGAT family acyltransferase
MQRVSSLDAGMLYAETPETPMHTMAVVILEPGAGPPPFEVMRRLFEQRMHLLAPLRRRLVHGPLQIGDPHWIEDPEFDLDNHLRRAAIPSPGSLRELAEFVGDFASRLLERSKPLWEIALVEGLEGGKLAVVTKIHHASMDGGRVVALLLGHLFDPTPEGSRLPPPGESRTPDRVPSLAWFAADAARALATSSIRLAEGSEHRAATGRTPRDCWKRPPRPSTERSHGTAAWRSPMSHSRTSRSSSARSARRSMTSSSRRAAAPYDRGCSPTVASPTARSWSACQWPCGARAKRAPATGSR